MKCTNEKSEIKNQNMRTSRIWKIISEHKFMTTILSMFISFSILNGLLIINFLSLLEKITYIH